MKRSVLKLSRRSALIMAGSLVVLVVAGMYGYSAWSRSDVGYTVAPMSQSEKDDRKSRIAAIYDSLNLGTEYAQTSENLFGEKRIYTWDKGRSFASSRAYVRQLDVDKTVAELRTKIEAAGFTLMDEPYAGAVDVQLHFKSAKGEYLRLTVSSQPRDEAIRQASKDGREPDYDNLPYRTAPANVLIKVNLDDNNE